MKYKAKLLARCQLVGGGHIFHMVELSEQSLGRAT
jgi:hypothetical protein